jgi:hypothetical protein
MTRDDHRGQPVGPSDGDGRHATVLTSPPGGSGGLAPATGSYWLIVP